jgi:uroporphyrinogen-III synthase
VRRLTVLNTRPSEQAAELSILLRAAGFDPVEAPAIAIEPAWVPDELESTRRALAAGTYAFVVLASANAARGLQEHLPHARAVCGAATARALALHPVATLDRFSAAVALDALKPLVRSGDRVLVPRAAEGRDELVDGLHALGADVHAPVAYRTVASSAAGERFRAGGIDVVTLCSPSAVRSIASALGAHGRVVCLGGTTAQAARELGLQVDGVAHETSMRSLVEAIGALAGAHV